MKALPIPTPCTVPWEEMTPTRGGRHCARCDRTVVDLSALTPTRVAAWVALHAATGFCARQRVDPEGELVLAPPRRVPAPPPPMALAALALAVGAAPAYAEAPPDAPVATEPALAPLVGVEATTRGQVLTRELLSDILATSSGYTTGVVVMATPRAVFLQTLLPGAANLAFDFKKHRLPATAAPFLDEIAAILLEHEELTRILVRGNITPEERAAHAGERLSRQRALAVRDALLARGVPADRLQTAPRGADLPEAPGADRLGAPLVDFLICDPACAAQPSDGPR